VLRLEQLRRERAARRDRLRARQFRLSPKASVRASWWPSWSTSAKGYGGKRVIDDFSCVIQRGDKIGLIGPNGCGKTTLLRLIARGTEPDAGSVRLGTKLSIAYFRPVPGAAGRAGHAHRSDFARSGFHRGLRVSAST